MAPVVSILLLYLFLSRIVSIFASLTFYANFAILAQKVFVYAFHIRIFIPMLDKISKILIKIFGSRNERLVKAYSVIAKQAGEFEEQIQKAR